MSGYQVIESGMTFKVFDPDCFFHIERSATYRGINKNVKISEFILLQNESDIIFIEAKQSSPSPDSKEHFGEFIDEIYFKMQNTLILFLGLKLKRPFSTIEDLPLKLQQIELSSARIKFLLIIKGHRKEWLPPISDACKRRCNVLAKTFAINIDHFVVINDTQAVSFGLIEPSKES